MMIPRSLIQGFSCLFTIEEILPALLSTLVDSSETIISSPPTTRITNRKPPTAKKFGQLSSRSTTPKSSVRRAG